MVRSVLLLVAIVSLSILGPVACSQGLGGKDLEKIDIRGVRLGMSVEEVKAILGDLEVREAVTLDRYHFSESSEAPNPVRVSASTGYGFTFPTSQSWGMRVLFTDGSHGMSAFDIREVMPVKRDGLNEQAFTDHLREELRSKYGSPSFEASRPQFYSLANFYWCWGSGCRLAEQPDLERISRYELDCSRIPRGRYLMVYWHPGTAAQVNLRLFDTSPYHSAMEALEKQKIQNAKKPIPF